MRTFKSLVLGGCVIKQFGLTSSSVVLRTIYVQSLVILIISIAYFLCIFIEFGFGIDVVEKPKFPIKLKYLYYMIVMYGASFWGIYIAFRAEFVSKYTQLTRVFELVFSRSDSIRKITDGQIFLFSISDDAFNFVEDCLAFGMERNRYFMPTFNLIVGAVLSNREVNYRFYRAQVSDLPYIRDYLSKTIRIFLLVEKFKSAAMRSLLSICDVCRYEKSFSDSCDDCSNLVLKEV